MIHHPKSQLIKIENTVRVQRFTDVLYESNVLHVYVELNV